MFRAVSVHNLGELICFAQGLSDARGLLWATMTASAP
jgi:hypothetical protein